MHGGGGRRTRPVDSRGQTETIATVLILAMTLIGATVVLAYGATGLNEARASSHEEGVRNAMTQLDSQSARVALGDSTAQRVALARGSYHADPGAGWINITHINHTGSGDDEVLYNDSLGAVIYDGDDVTIAYQGGGVWQSTGNRSTMVSPPEFHYRGSTLTLPVVRIVSSDSRSGSVAAEISSDTELRRIFPNESVDYDADSSSYTNPVNEGNVSVTIHSDYYQAWAEYFRTRTEGEITVYDSNNTVEVLLFTPSTIGDFSVPNEGNGLDVNSMGDNHPVDQFEITLKPDPHFNNMHWAFYADEGSDEFELHVHSPTKCSGSSYDGNLDVSIYYYNGTGGTYQGWQNSSVDPDTSPLASVDCDNEELTIDFMAATTLEYKQIDITGSDNKWYYGDQISDLAIAPETTFDQHEDAVADEPETYVDGDGDQKAMGFLVNHYFSILGPSFELRVTDGPGGSSRVDEDASSGSLDFDESGSGQFITFLHITENRVTVELE